MIVAVHVSMNVSKGSFVVSDHRVLAAAHQILLDRDPVIACDLSNPDFVARRTLPVFVVSLVDVVRKTGRMPITTMMDELTEPGVCRIVYTAAGGWKTELVNLAFEVQP